jgi:hypothetical protein
VSAGEADVTATESRLRSGSEPPPASSNAAAIPSSHVASAAFSVISTSRLDIADDESIGTHEHADVNPAQAFFIWITCCAELRSDARLAAAKVWSRSGSADDVPPEEPPLVRLRTRALNDAAIGFGFTATSQEARETREDGV